MTIKNSKGLRTASNSMHARRQRVLAFSKMQASNPVGATLTNNFKLHYMTGGDLGINSCSALGNMLRELAVYDRAIAIAKRDQLEVLERMQEVFTAEAAEDRKKGDTV